MLIILGRAQRVGAAPSAPLSDPRRSRQIAADPSGSSAHGRAPGCAERVLQLKRRMFTFATNPMAMKLVMIAEPPYDMNGNGMPVIGMMPMVMPMFSKI